MAGNAHFNILGDTRKLDFSLNKQISNDEINIQPVSNKQRRWLKITGKELKILHRKQNLWKM